MFWPIALVLASLTASPGAVADTTQVPAYGESEVLVIPWGEGKGKITRIPLETKEQLSGPGPYALGDDGKIYIYDPAPEANCLQVYDPATGTWGDPIFLEKRSNMMHDLAVSGGIVYWTAQAFNGVGRVLSYDSNQPAGKRLTEYLVTDSHFLNGDGRRRYDNPPRLAVQGPGNVSLYGERSGRLFPIIRAGVAVDTAEQAVSSSAGYPAGDRRVCTAWEGTRTRDGQRVGRADIISLDSDGVPETIVTKFTGLFRDARFGLVLHGCMDKTKPGGRFYMCLRRTDGTLVSRTPLLSRPYVGQVYIYQRFRLAADATFYEMNVTDEGVMLSHWTP